MSNSLPTTPSLPPRARGGACLECRRKKKRCDGGQPCLHCRNAIAGPLDCEYAAIGGLAESQVLEQDIARLEEQIYLLENPEQSKSSTVFLHAPYISSHPPRAEAARFDPVTFHREAQPSLITTFLEHFEIFGLFLNPNTIRRSIHHQIPSLGAVVLLWASHLTPDFNNPETINGLLYKVLSQVQADIGGTHPQRAIQTIQVDVLLALWYLNTGSFIQARYRANHAVSLCISERLHLNSSPIDHQSATLSPPLNMVEAKQRIDAFWTTLVVANLFALDGSLIPFNYPSDNPAVTTVWPSAGDLLPAPPRNTITDFLRGLHPWSNLTPLTFIARASILYERTIINLNLSTTSGSSSSPTILSNITGSRPHAPYYQAQPKHPRIPQENVHALENRLVAMKAKIDEQNGLNTEMFLSQLILDVALLTLHCATSHDNLNFMSAQVSQIAQSLKALNTISIVPIVLPLLVYTIETSLRALKKGGPVHTHEQHQLKNSLNLLLRWLERVAPFSPASARELEHLRSK